MKIIVTIIPADLIRNSILTFFGSFLQTKNKNQVFSMLVVWYQEIYLVFGYSELRLLQSHAEVNRLL